MMYTKLIKRILVAGLALVGLMAGQAVYAQTTSATVAVSAVVPKACRFYSSPAAMLIQHGGGVIDPLSAVNATGSSAIDYKCQTGVDPQFDIGNPTVLSGTYASPKTRVVPLAGASTNLNASITVTSGGTGTGLGAGQEISATISGIIAPADFQTALADTYSATVTIAIQAVP
jgi:hypothetical protein